MADAQMYSKSLDFFEKSVTIDQKSHGKGANHESNLYPCRL